MSGAELAKVRALFSWSDYIKPLLTVVSVAGWIVIGKLVERAIRGLQLTRQQRARALKLIRSVGLFLILSTQIAIWAEELRAAAFVVSAFAVAIAITSKEIVQCVMGWWVKMAGHEFRIGDRISIGSFTGEVLDYGLLTTTLLEVRNSGHDGDSVGNVMSLPNSLLLTNPVRNETRALSFSVRSLRVDVSKAQWEMEERRLTKIGEEMWKLYSSQATEELRQFRESYPLYFPELQPRVFVTKEQNDIVTLELRMAFPIRRIQEIEDKVWRMFLRNDRAID